MVASTVKRMPRVGLCHCGGAIHARGLCSKHYRAALAPSRRVNLCGCGCGGKTKFTFVHGHHTRLFSNEEQARRGRQNDGSTMRDTGAGKGYRKMRGRHEHRRVMEQKLQRKLLSSEIVHHKDEDKKNNHPDNLELMTRAEHIRHHLHAR
jgi:hypothetical protein